jgi:hypothetical protein
LHGGGVGREVVVVVELVGLGNVTVKLSNRRKLKGLVTGNSNLMKT